jgi:hypothetical protein
VVLESGAMQIDLTKLTPGQIAVITGLATLLASLGGFFALTVALLMLGARDAFLKPTALESFASNCTNRI